VTACSNPAATAAAAAAAIALQGMPQTKGAYAQPKLPLRQLTL
jgi:hypothetical protein